MKEITIAKEIAILKYGETYKVNIGLTKKLNMPGWVVYKDPDYGLFSYNKEFNLDIYLFCKKISLKDPLLDKVIWFWRLLIADRVKDNLEEKEKEALGGRNEVTES